VTARALAAEQEMERLEAEVATLTAERDEFQRKYHEAMDVLTAWGNIDSAHATARMIAAEAERDEALFKAEQRWVEREALRAALERSDEANDFAYGALRDATDDCLDKPAGYAVIRMIQDARVIARAALRPDDKDYDKEKS
jgi:hypothetical protein